MAYLLDTPTLAEVLRSSPSRALVRRLSTIPTPARWTSAATVSQPLVAALRTQQPRLMQDVVNLVAGIRVAPFDLAAAQSFAKFRATVGAQLEADDVMQAAIAASSGMTLVTKRIQHYGVFPTLRLEDWTV